jgi:hypothetical protein
MNRRFPISATALSVWVLLWLVPTGACQVDGGSNSGGMGGGTADRSGAGGAAGSQGGSISSGSRGGGDTASQSGSGGANDGGAAGHGTSGGAGIGGSSATGGSFGAGGSSSTLANFATVREIVSVTCGGTSCHQAGDTPPTLLVDDAKLYSTLTTFVSKKCGNRVLVNPGSPQDSAFYLAQAGLCGATLSRMPFGCVDRCTPADYLEGVRQWIANGATQQP